MTFCSRQRERERERERQERERERRRSSKLHLAVIIPCSCGIFGQNKTFRMQNIVRVRGELLDKELS